MLQQISIKHAVRGPWWSREVQRTPTENAFPSYTPWVQHEGPPPPGVLHGDTWNPTTGEICRGSHGGIVGIVDFVAKVRYGFSSRGVPQYLFHPADPRWPPMIVGSKAAPTANQWGVISTKDLVWSTTKSRWPQVSLQRLLGPVGDPAVEADALRQRYLRPCGIPHWTKSGSCSGSGSNASSDMLEALEVDETWEEVFNVDPAGCRDVDDILAWRKGAEEGSYVLGIGIALVAALVPPGSPEDVAARQRAQTLYRDGIAIEPMLPTSISEGAGSLLADGVPRGVLMASWTVWPAEGRCAGPDWSTCRIVNKRTFTYESVLEDSYISNMLPQLLAPLCYRGVGATGVGVGTDPHRWIEVAMIAYNCAAAEMLGALGTGILRRHRGVLRANDLSQVAAKTGCAELAFLGYAAGEYVAARKPIFVNGVMKEPDVAHAGLGVSRYCHATSPLRRYADLVSQRCLVGLLRGTDVWARDVVDRDIVPWLNERAKEARAIEREGWCLAQLSATELRSEDGWVVGWSLKADQQPLQVRLRVYVPAWRRLIKVPLNLLEQRLGTEAIRVEDRGGATVGSEDGEKGYWLTVGSAVRITAFWDTRSTPEHRFVFRCDSLPAKDTQ